MIHVEATDEAGHAGNLAEKVAALEHWDRRILAGLVDGLDAHGPVAAPAPARPPHARRAEDPHLRLGARTCWWTAVDRRARAAPTPSRRPRLPAGARPPADGPSPRRHGGG